MQQQAKKHYIQPASLLTTCMKVLRENLSRANMTILPTDLADKLSQYLRCGSDTTEISYHNCIAIDYTNLCYSFSKLSPIKVNPNAKLIYEPHIHPSKVVECLHVTPVFRNKYKRLYKFVKQHIDTRDRYNVYVIKLSNINPIVLKYMLEHKHCFYIPDVPSYCF